MNRKSTAERAKILQLLVEGNSLRATSRIADCSINTVYKLFADAGEACNWYQDQVLRNLTCQRIEVDEIWSFVYARRQNVRPDMEVPAGDIWTWTALCPDTKLMVSWYIGNRDRAAAEQFMLDLCQRFQNRIQLTSDGMPAYKDAVDNAFGSEVDFAMLVKQYSIPKGKQLSGPYTGAIQERRIGNPDMSKARTTFVERHNLTMRTNIKRFTRRTNAHSKKIENHAYAVALHCMYYNFVRIHSSLKVTPAMAAGVTNKLWSLQDLVDMIDSY
ncbi:MAG TPA: IS1 family transposase [Alphaproteobacteria bacterium]